MQLSNSVLKNKKFLDVEHIKVLSTVNFCKIKIGSLYAEMQCYVMKDDIFQETVDFINFE